MMATTTETQMSYNSKVYLVKHPKIWLFMQKQQAPQKDSVCRALTAMLPKLDKDPYNIELRLVPVLTYKTDDNLAARLKHVAIKHSQITSNTKAYEIEGIDNIGDPLPND